MKVFIGNWILIYKKQVLFEAPIEFIKNDFNYSYLNIDTSKLVTMFPHSYLRVLKDAFGNLYDKFSGMATHYTRPDDIRMDCDPLVLSEVYNELTKLSGKRIGVDLEKINITTEFVSKFELRNLEEILDEILIGEI